MISLQQSSLILGLCGVLAALPVQAEKADDRLRVQLRDSITQLRALTSENAQLKAQLAQASAKPTEDPEKVSRLQKSLSKLQTERDLLRGQLQEASASQKASTETQKAQADAGQAEKLSSLQKLVAEQRNAQRNGQALAQCTADNRTLVSIADEVIERYRNRGVFDAALAREPLTGLRRVQLERMAQTYEIRVGDHTLRQATATPDVGSSAASAIDTGKPQQQGNP